MSAGAHKLLELLPAILRIRDQSLAEITPGWLDPGERVALADLAAKVANSIPLTAGEPEHLAQLQQLSMAGPLASLLAVIAEQIAVLQEDLDQLYDDQFIETCAPWLTSYIGDLVGYRALSGISPKVANPRADVGRTIAYRRRKGTIVIVEDLARGVTGWNATAVEYFQHLVMTQYMNHRRLHCLAAPDLRKWEKLERIGTAFDTIAHTVDVRRIASGRGRYNIPNIGVFLWRLNAYPLSRSPAAQVDARRWRFNPLGIDQPLFTLPQTVDDIAQLATPLNVPAPISRRVLDANFERDYYTGASSGDVTRSLRLYTWDSANSVPQAPQAVISSAVCVCNLADFGSGWAHQPPTGNLFAVDPVLGRVAASSPLPTGTELLVDFHYGFSADIGGGEYERAASFETAAPPFALVRVSKLPPPQLPSPPPPTFTTIQAALNALSILLANAGVQAGGVVEIIDSCRYQEILSIDVAAGQWVELRAANGVRPTLVLSGDLALKGAADSEIRLDGLLVAGAALYAAATQGNQLRNLHISHCTLVPGGALAPDCTPASPGQPSLTADLVGLDIAIDHSIVGGLRIHPSAQVGVTDSIIDATATTGIAYAAPVDTDPGAPLSLDACTVIGKLHALTLPLVTNSLLLADLSDGDTWTAPVIAARRQEGCIRFSYVPAGARVPRRYQCLPEAAASPELAAPRFTTLRYGFPAYAQLSTRAGAKLLTGADDEGQPGAFHSLYQPRREANLRVRLDEYLRAGLEAGIFYES